MVDSENILILVVLIYGVVSAILIERYRNKITELEKDKEK